MIEQKIEQLKSDFKNEDSDSYNQILDWEKEYTRNKDLLKIKEMDLVKDILDSYRTKIKKIDKRLLNERNMSPEEREAILVKKECYKEFLNIFRVEERLQTIKKNIKDQTNEE